MEKIDPKIDFLITTEAALVQYVNDLRSRGVVSLAVDMEGDQGSIRYEYSISIFQCFDGVKSAIIDVLALGKSEALCRFLTNQDIVKVMFSCQNDIFMAQNVLGCTIAPVRDIAIAQKLLGLPVNLAAYLNIDKKDKDAFQRANWLQRPLPADLIEYAINDVLMLLDIEKNLVPQLQQRKLYNKYLHEAVQITRKNYAVDQFWQYETKFPGYASLSRDKKEIAGILWAFREFVGKQFDTPVGYLLSRKSMLAIVEGSGKIVDMLERELNASRGPGKKLTVEFISEYLDKAIAFRKKSC